jgi:general stress protein 26
MNSRRRRLLLAILSALYAMSVLLGASVTAHAALSDRDLKALGNASLIYIATVRKDGNQSTSAPVWFIMSKGNTLLIQTGAMSWKAKRIRRGSPAMIWIGEKDGPAFIAKAAIESDKDSQQEILQGIPRKYMLARLGIVGPSQKKFDAGTLVVIRFTQVRDFPDGFASQPGTPAPALESK